MGWLIILPLERPSATGRLDGRTRGALVKCRSYIKKKSQQRTCVLFFPALQFSGVPRIRVSSRKSSAYPFDDCAALFPFLGFPLCAHPRLANGSAGELHGRCGPPRSRSRAPSELQVIVRMKSSGLPAQRIFCRFSRAFVGQVARADTLPPPSLRRVREPSAGAYKEQRMRRARREAAGGAGSPTHGRGLRRQRAAEGLSRDHGRCRRRAST